MLLGINKEFNFNKTIELSRLEIQLFLVVLLLILLLMLLL